MFHIGVLSAFFADSDFMTFLPTAHLLTLLAAPSHPRKRIHKMSHRCRHSRSHFITDTGFGSAICFWLMDSTETIHLRSCLCHFTISPSMGLLFRPTALIGRSKMPENLHFLFPALPLHHHHLFHSRLSVIRHACRQPSPELLGCYSDWNPRRMY